jgi:sugar phosphate isomerase/epimerase
MMPRLLVSTTSHKAEPLLTALEVFARLDLRDVDLNLHHVIELNLDVEAIRRVVEAFGLRVWALSGGWCDFFHGPPRIDDTFRSVERQVAAARQFGVDLLRLFFGRLPLADYSATRLDQVCGNLRELSDRYPDVRFVFENHDGVSLDPAICRDVLARVGRPNIRMNFDPINFERHGVDSRRALDVVRPFVAHVHLKGLQHSEFCEFGVGDVDLTPVLRTLLASGYTGSFSVEYEGPFDKTLRLYQSVERARSVLASLTPSAA